ncbi:Wadjet anti-phage system protein JetD domain-containing protein [Aliikangiella coralliicola]|uniref:Wadjet protein JetD C-terminal domain-containing protein n=1 Tax=Aliikangiella coralliicola TaxID=2592383 RepID=A0A545UBR6_9GAMM|nr:Wadjet anti-phage system protein JetD domain-containing protein [Aliikangiella coralliicola]TQV86909.1 hypothetical protein FLL46_13915 [Aliikangiella coralliicola]
MLNQLLEKPPWLAEEKAIEALLVRLLKRAEKSAGKIKTSAITLAESTFQRDETGELSWSNLNTLADTILEIRSSKKIDAYEYPWVRAKVSLLMESENLVRSWLSIEKSELVNWQSAIAHYVTTHPEVRDHCNFESLKKNAISFTGKTSNEILDALFSLSEDNQSSKTLKELSAKYFWGDSKVLEAKSDWLKQTFPRLKVFDKQIMVNFYLPEDYQCVLFVENKDTFHQLISKKPQVIDQAALVYCSGFLGAATRIRDTASINFFQAIESIGTSARLIDWWLNDSNHSFPVHFWGDFDFAAMAILKALRNNFENAQAWRPGYGAMLEAVEYGHGHSISHRKKQGQNDPVKTGCHFADQIVLPSLRNRQYCFDQEGIDFNQLEAFKREG